MVLLAVVCLLVTVPSSLGFLLDGSQASFAQFRKWNAGLNGSLELEFKTEQSNGLLLYTDDGGTYDFFEIKLVEGALRLRYNLGGGAQILTVGRELHDGHWHKVQVQRRVERTTLTVDGASQTRTSRGKEFQFGKVAGNSDVYVGGMPSWYNTKLTHLALPSVIFEPRFVGSVRNLVYADEDSSLPRRQEMRRTKEHKCSGQHCSTLRDNLRGVRVNGTDVCEDVDPCKHGGICITTDSGPICECRNLDYEGTYCEKDKAPSEATFRGSEFLSYDLNSTGAEPIVSTQDILSLSFKTRFPNGLLFYTGDGQDYLNVALKEGGVIISMSLGNGRLEMNINPNKVRFDDNQWHKLVVHRKVQEISAVTSFCRLSAVVDGIYSDHSHIAGTSTMLSSSKVYVGGSHITHALPGSKIHNNFVGCLRKVEFSADTLKLNIIDLGRTESKLVTAAGNIDYMCQEDEGADPITFMARDAHLVLPNWDAARGSTMAFKIRTNEANGLIMYSSGNSASSSHPDLFAYEMIDGHLFLHIDLGSGPLKTKVTTKRIDDGAWHEITLRRNARDGRVSVDDAVVDFTTPGESHQLDLDGGLYIGGAGSPIAPLKVPPFLWTGVLRQGYVGCMRDLIINGNAVDIAGYARQQDSTAIRPSCHVQSTQCDTSPCLNDGACSEGWNRFVCDCSTTGFIGPICGKDASTMILNGTQYLSVSLAETMETQVEDVTLRFRTTRPAGLLFSTNADRHGDRLELALIAGKIRMNIRIGDLDKTITTGQSLNDNLWHTLKLSRRASHFNLELDEEQPVRTEKDLGHGNLLRYKNLYLGAYPSADNEVNDRDVPGFTGSLQQFTFNDKPYLELARTAHHYQTVPSKHATIKTTAKFTKRDHLLVHHPVTFRSKHTFVGLPVLKAYSTTNLYFQFKTREPNGLLVYNGGKEHDFIALELVNGHVHYIFNMGDSAVRVRDNTKATLNDNRWHAVTVGRPTIKQHTLTVDDNLAVVTTLGHNDKLDLAGILYLGGVRKDIYPTLHKQIQSRQGFEGCIASLDLNGESPNILLEAVVPSSQVVSGCEGQSSKCSHSVCANRGVCVQQWNSFACDCDTTSFTGPTCSEESISFEFGSAGGLITFVYPEDRRPEMKSDVITLGFLTTKEDCVLLRIDGGTSNDYMELEIVEGNVFMVYNMGTNDHPIGEINVKVNDNSYHVVRFARTGANSTIQVDDYNVQSIHPAGHQLTVFNAQAQIQVGGKWNRAKQRVERGFAGIISGLVFNGQRLLDLASDKDPRTSIRGDVQVTTGIRSRAHETQRMQQTPASNFPGVMDDLVYSGAGSGCQNDDEDQCLPVFDTGSGDDLITPIYIPPTPRPTPGRTNVIPGQTGGSQGGKPFDDEDSFVGSGSGEITTEDKSGAGTSTSSRGSTTVDSTTVEESGKPGSTTGSSSSEAIDATSPDNTSTSGGGGGSSTSSSSTAVSTSGTTTGTTRQTTTSTTSTEYPEPLPPAPPRPTQRSTDGKKRDRISSEAAENTALVIGIIAGTMIAIILVILIILRFKNRGPAAYKTDEAKSYPQQGASASAALLPAASSGFQQHNGSLRNGNNNGNGRQGARKQKDVKEWYV